MQQDVPDPDVPLDDENRVAAPEAESTVWKGSIGQVVNWKAYLVCLLLFWLVIPIFYALYVYFVTKARKYEITTQRIICHVGVFSKHTDELELYRVKDLRVDEPFVYRMFHRGIVTMETSDRTHPTFRLIAVPEPLKLRDTIRNLVEKRRDVKGVREID